MKKDPPRLETPRLVLRGHGLDDFEACAAMWADPNVVRYISGKPSSREESWSRLLKYAGHWRLLGFGYWLVEDRKTGAFLGEVGLADYRRLIEPSLQDKAEAGWVFKTSAHGQGFATEAVLRVVDWADSFIDNRQTVCLIHPDHTASIQVASKAGYVEIYTTSYRNEPTLIMERNITPLRTVARDR